MKKTDDMLLDECRVLTPDETNELIKKLKENDLNAREELIKHNLQLVKSIAKNYPNSSILDSDDLFQAGVLGLIEAIDRYDAEKGSKISTYAYDWIRQRIIHAIDSTARAVRYPTLVAQKSREINRYINVFYQSYGSYPTIEEIAEDLEIPKELVIKIQNVEQIISLDEPVGNDVLDSDVTLMNYISSEMDIEKQITDQIFVDTIINLIKEDNTTSERHKDIFMRRFGLNGKEPETLQSIGDRYNLRREAVRQITNNLSRKYRIKYLSYFYTGNDLKKIRSRF